MYHHRILLRWKIHENFRGIFVIVQDYYQKLRAKSWEAISSPIPRECHYSTIQSIESTMAPTATTHDPFGTKILLAGVSNMSAACITNPIDVIKGTHIIVPPSLE